MDALRLRLEEKESLLSKKSQQMSELTEEKSTQHGEITDLKDMLDVKERKVNVLQKKARKYLLFALDIRGDLSLPVPLMRLGSGPFTRCNFTSQPLDGAVFLWLEAETEYRQIQSFLFLLYNAHILLRLLSVYLSGSGP